MRRRAPSIAFLLAAAVIAGSCSVPYEGEPSYRPRALESPPVVGEAREPASTAALNLQQCIQRALDSSRGIAIADRRILMARDRLDEVTTDLYPRVFAEGRYQARTNDQGGDFMGQSFVLGDRDVGSGRVSLLVPIYTFGLVSSKQESETIQEEISALDAERAREDLTLAVSLAYYRLLEAQRIQEVVAESIGLVERQLQIARDFYEQGLVARNDVLTAEVQLADRRQQAIQAENNVQLARATINRLMSLDVGEPTRIVDVLETEPWQGSFESALQVAVEKRPDLEALRLQVDVARAEYRVTAAGDNPYVYGFGDYMYSSDSFLINDDWLQGGVVLTIPIFDGYSTPTRLRRKEKEIAQAVDVHDDRMDDIVLEVKKAHLNVRDAGARIPVAQKSIDQAQDNLRITRDQYAEGWLTSADVLREADRLSRTRVNYYRALYDYHSAFASLVHVLGDTPPPPDGAKK
jgi:outer membrane protein TolC